MLIHELPMKGLYMIDCFCVEDVRGRFFKIYEEGKFELSLINFELSETFVTISHKNVIRGLHFQKRNPQAKIVSVVSGSAWDVVVDLRPGSETYGKYYGIELSDKNGKAVYIPKGFAHGFAAFKDQTIMLYQCDGKYDHDTDSGIRFDDSFLKIDWKIPMGEQIILSERDRMLQDFREYEKNPMKL